MNVEVYLFAGLAGLYAALIFVLIGVYIGKIDCKVLGKSDTGDVRHTDTNSNALSDRDDKQHFGDMGINYGEEHNRYDMGLACYVNGKITLSCSIRALQLIRLELNGLLSRTEKDALDYFINKGEEDEERE